jgi:arylsulfatase A-like enzyme
MKEAERHKTGGISFWVLFRMIFVLFCLYLLPVAFSRWDGFSYYASFSEFLPSVSLVFILWSVIAVMASAAAWLVLRAMEWFFSSMKLRIKIDHIILFSGILILLGALVWKSKKILWPDVETDLQVKLIVFVSVVFVAALFIFMIRRKAETWLHRIQDRITPLVWIFGIFVLLSVPFVAYSAWFKDTDTVLPTMAEQPEGLPMSRPNIILVTFDAFAAREMSLYGYHRKTTPFIDKWAGNATIFSKTESASNFTASAAASLMTGKRVWTHQTYHIEGSKPVKSVTESLPFLLKENGYFNIALVVNPFASVRKLGLSGSFDVAPPASDFGNSDSLFGWKFGVVDRMLYRAFGDKVRLHNWIVKNDFILSKVINLISRNIYETSVPPEKAFNRLLQVLDGRATRPYFAWIHLFPPHDPYLPPEPFKGKFNSLRKMRAYKPQERLVEESYKFLFQFRPVPEKMRPLINLMRDYYDEYIYYIDSTFKDFIDELQKKREENTVIILSADHGESFDHGYFTHGGPFLYEEVTHIPLIIKEPGQIKGRIEDAVAEQIDIPATILDFAGIPVPLWMEGRSLVPLIRGKNLSGKVAFSMNFEENRSRGHRIEIGSIAVWDGDYKLIHYLGREETLLFNLRDDPEEMNNLVETKPEMRQDLLRTMKHALAEANKRIAQSK